jgi:two-component system alkaline phosphatase synthesis response regulator PhoP
VEKTLRILIIDCETDFMGMAKKAFESSFNITCASIAEEGLRKAKTEVPDLIVLGYLEPRGVSRQVASRLAEDKVTAKIPILVVDVRPEEYPRKGWRWSDGFSPNVKGYVWRPIDAVELKKTVEGVLQRAKASTMNLTEVAEQTEEMLKRIDQLKKLLMSRTEN